MELTWFSISSVKREANTVAHSLARYVRHIREDVFWIEDSPPLLWKLCLLILLIFINEIFFSLFKKKKKIKFAHHFYYELLKKIAYFGKQK